MLQAYRDAAALHTVIELDLFTRIAHGTDTAHRIASELDVPERGIRLLCDFLAGAGLIMKDGEGFKLAADATMFLEKLSPSYLGEAVAKVYSTPLLRAFERLTESVRGQPTGKMAPMPRGWLEIARGVTDPAVAARAFAEAVALPQGPLKILDVCAGDGLYGIAIAGLYPEAIVVAADRKAVLKAAHENAARAGLGTRYQNISGDILEMPFGRKFDCAICAGGLYQFDPPQIELLMKRILDALKKTGQLIILEFVVEGRLEYAGFGLTMLTATRRGGAYTLAELQSMLRSSGFASSESQPLPAAHATMITARP